jgi:uncharacterized DUF497 family protein
MEFEFDHLKSASNLEKHGISLMKHREYGMIHSISKFHPDIG